MYFDKAPRAQFHKCAHFSVFLFSSFMHLKDRLLIFERRLQVSNHIAYRSERECTNAWPTYNHCRKQLWHLWNAPISTLLLLLFGCALDNMQIVKSSAHERVDENNVVTNKIILDKCAFDLIKTTPSTHTNKNQTNSHFLVANQRIYARQLHTMTHSAGACFNSSFFGKFELIERSKKNL